MAKRKKGTVGIIGLGIMGGAFAKNLTAEGWRVIGFDVDAAARRAATRARVEVVKDAVSVAKAASTIITSLPSPQALDATVAAFTAAKLRRKTIIEASTFTLDDKLRAEAALRKAGHIVLDCPVSGTGAQAKTRDLVVYASGDTAAIKKTKRLFASFTRGVYDLGAFGNGSKMKFVANHLVTVHNVAAAEALVLGMKAGLDPQMVYEVISDSAGSSRMFQVRGPMMVEGRYDTVTATNQTHLKDIGIIGAFAASLNFPMPMFNLAAQYYHAAVAQGRGAQDTGAVCAVVESMAGTVRGA